MEQVNLKAAKREKTGKCPSRRLRREGKVPAILYGTEMEGAVSLALQGNELEKALQTDAGTNVLVNLEIDGSEAKTVMFKAIERDPVKDFIGHVDLYEIVKGHKITVEVPVHVEGKPAGAEEGGILQHLMRELTIECLPSEIPEAINVDVSPLNIGDSFHVSDVKLSGDVRVLHEPGDTIVAVAAPSMEEIETVSAEEAEEAIAEATEGMEATEQGPKEEGEKEE